MLVPTPTVSLRQCLDNISNAKVMFTAQCSRRNVHGAKSSLMKFCVGLITTINRTIPCPLAIRALYLT